MISSTMITAIRKVHIKNGPWVTKGGYEYNLTLIAAMAMLAEAGPGRPSVDDALFPGMRGTGWAIAALGAAAAGSYLATEYFNEQEPAPAPHEGQADTPGDPALEQQPRFSREGAEAPVQQGS
jgi:putative oxidoreductase